MATDELAAVKIIEKKHLNKLERSFLNEEIEVIKCIRHPHIVQFKDVFETNTHAYIVMELVVGGELRGLVQRCYILKSQVTKIAH